MDVVKFEQGITRLMKTFKMAIAKNSFDDKTLRRCVEYRRFAPEGRKEREGK